MLQFFFLLKNINYILFKIIACYIVVKFGTNEKFQIGAEHEVEAPGEKVKEMRT